MNGERWANPFVSTSNSKWFAPKTFPTLKGVTNAADIRQPIPSCPVPGAVSGQERTPCRRVFVGIECGRPANSRARAAKATLKITRVPCGRLYFVVAERGQPLRNRHPHQARFGVKLNFSIACTRSKVKHEIRNLFPTVVPKATSGSRQSITLLTPGAFIQGLQEKRA